MSYAEWYGNLSKDEREIRLLIIDWSDTEDENAAEFTLIRTNLDDPLGPYVALSYVWGETTETTSIIINGHSFEIRKNLKAALMAVAHNARVCTDQKAIAVWADAVCINQADAAEKAHQVRMMGDIYRNSACTMIWLGESSQEQRSSCGMESISKLAQMMRIRYEMEDREWSSWDDFIRDATHPDGFWYRVMKKLSFHSFARGFDIDAIIGLANRPWWTRMWTVQEAALPRELFFMCGADLLTWDDWILASGLLSAKLVTLSTGLLLSQIKWINKKVSYISALRKKVADRQSSPGLYEASVMLRIEDRNCALEQDRIFGLLGMANDIAANAIDINYRLNKREVYIQCAKAIISCDGLEILSQCHLHAQYHLVSANFREHSEELYEIDEEETEGNSSCASSWSTVSSARTLRGSEKDPESLPSWVPDWRHHRGNFAESEKSEFCASKTLSQPSASFEFGTDDSLILNGIVFDVIENVARAASAFATLNHWFQHLAELVQSSTVYGSSPGNSLRNEAIWRTTCGNSILKKNIFSRTPTAQDGRFFHLLLGHTLEKALDLDAYKYENSHESDPRIDDIPGSYRISAFWPKQCIDEYAALNESLATYMRSVDLQGSERLVYVTHLGYLGLGPASARAGDKVCIFADASIPYVLREIDASGKFQLVGGTYVHGIMHGEMDFSSRETQQFQIV